MFDFSSWAQTTSTLYVCLHDAMERSTDSLQQAAPALAAKKCPGSRGCASQPTAWCRKVEAQCQHGGIWPFPWDSHHALLTEREQSYIPPPVYFTCASCLQDNPWSDIQHTGPQPHHYSSAPIMLTNELHTRNCSHMLPSDSISLSKRKIAFNISKVLLLWKRLWQTL